MLKLLILFITFSVSLSASIPIALDYFRTELENLYEIQNTSNVNKDIIRGKIEAYHEVILYLESFST